MTKETKDLIHRRTLLLRLGLAAGAAYVTPALAGLDVARASTGSSGGGGRSSGPSRSSGSSRSSSPSRPDRQSRSGASRPRGGNSSTQGERWRWRWDSATGRWVRVRVSG